MPIKNSSDNKFLKILVKFSAQLYVGWVFFIALLTLLPGSYLPTISWDFISIDKPVHIIMFGFLTFLALLNSNFGEKRIFRKWPVILSLSSAVLYGYIIELLQSFIPGRSYDYADLSADCVGTLVGYGLFIGISKILPLKQ